MNEEILIDIKKIIDSEVGTSCEIKFNNKTIDHIEDLKIEKPIEGSINVSNIGNMEIIADINIKATVSLTCARCLKDYKKNINLSYQQLFTYNPGEEDFPIRNDKKIDIYPSIRQEILINIPMKPLCNKNCNIKIN